MAGGIVERKKQWQKTAGTTAHAQENNRHWHKNEQPIIAEARVKESGQVR